VHIFYTPDIDIHASSYQLSEEESKHSSRVLRLKADDEIMLVNGKGTTFIARITNSHPKRTQASIVSSTFQEKARPYHLHLAVAPTKNIERYEWFLEKATEIGVDEITPLICEHAERKDVKHERLNKILVAAMKQSQQSFLPTLNDTIRFDEFIELPTSDKKFIAHCDEDEKYSLKSVLFAQQNSLILIGPEGDFSPSEIKNAISGGYVPVSLGQTRLRTETAALVACMEVSFLNR